MAMLQRAGGFQSLVKHYLDDPELLDLRHGVASIRASVDLILHEIDARRADGNIPGAIDLTTNLIDASDAFARVAERKSRIDNANALTIAQTQLYNIEFVRVLAVLPEEYKRAVLAAMEPCLLFQLPADLTAVENVLDSDNSDS
jgi:hypothetical protein